MEHMLRELREQPEYARLVQTLLGAFPATNGARPAPEPQMSQETPVSLTVREMEILHLLEDRLSNKEIARRLIVSNHTVRNHTANIYGKLQVENRLQAVERARDLGLLPAQRERTLLPVRA